MLLFELPYIVGPVYFCKTQIGPMYILIVATALGNNDKKLCQLLLASPFATKIF